MSHIYSNIYSRPNVQIDEARYQTIGRGHGFSELNGVPFKIADKYQFMIQESPGDLYQLANLHLGGVQALDEASYTFDIERKVLDNMELRGC